MPTVTRRQREVLDHLSGKAALTRESAVDVYGTDENVANKLAQIGTINKRYERGRGAVYWIRAKNESATGVSVPAGFVMILNHDVTTPSGRAENFFLARALYDGKGVTFRRLRQGWLTMLGLQPKDLLGYGGVELIEADAPVFAGDHVILDMNNPR